MPANAQENTLDVLVRAWRKAEGREKEEATELIIQRCLPSVRRIARSIAGRFRMPDEVDDLAHEGMIAILLSLHRFDMTRGTLFAHYAMRSVKRAITRAARQKGHVIRTPERRRNGKDSPSDDRFSPTGDVLNGEEYRNARPSGDYARIVPLDESLYCDNAHHLVESNNIGSETYRAFERNEAMRVIARAIRRCTKRARDRAMVAQRLGLTDGEEWSYERIARYHGISRQRVQRVVYRTLERMRRDRELLRWLEIGDDSSAVPIALQWQLPSAQGRTPTKDAHI